MILRLPYWTTRLPFVWHAMEPRFRRIPKGYEADFKVGHTRVIIKVVKERPAIG